VPLTPIQHWFFERDWKDRNLFCQSILCEVDRRLSDDDVERLVRQVAEQHDSFRLRFTSEEGKWLQRYAETAKPLFRRYEILGCDVVAEKAKLGEICRGLDGAMDIQSGPLFASALIRFSNDSRKLYVSIHHLVVDAVSWFIVLDEL